LRRGVPVGVATDGAASNNDLDMWEEMRLAALIAKGATRDATAVSAREALLMATRGGARCLNLPDVGVLQAGMKADIVLLDFDVPHLAPCHNVVSHLVYAAKASDVYATIVDGKILYRNGALQTLDETRIKAEARRSAARLAALSRA
jgi:5-methylthioadenosine/S-adenosylhomocysteine deaminase